jgi:predicted nucleic acid-binding protein
MSGVANRPPSVPAKPKDYWDSSALVKACVVSALRLRLTNEKGVTRKHALAETFAALTGKPSFGVNASQAATLLEDLLQDLQFVELTPGDYVDAAKAATAEGVRGGAIHDWLHVRAAIKAGALKFVSSDADFTKLLPAAIPLETP